MGIFKSTGQWYIDAKFGSDANPGNIQSRPFQTVTKAESVASPGDIFIIGSGFYKHINGTDDAFIYRGEGTVIFYGTGEVAGRAIPVKVESVQNITFFDYGSGAFATGFEFVISKTQKYINCRFYHCDIVNSGGAFDYIRNCDFVQCDFNQIGLPIGQYNVITQCNFLSCTGLIHPFVNADSGIFNSNFEDCNGLDLGLAAGLPDILKFDYNNVVGTLEGFTQAQIVALGGNTNGVSTAIAGVYNDYQARAKADWWKEDLTQLVASTVKTSGKNGTHIGNDFIAVILTAQDLWNNHQSSNVNLQLSGDVIDILAAGTGNFVSTEIDLGVEFTLGMLRLNSLQIYDANGAAIGYVYHTADAAPNPVLNQKTTYNLGIHEDTVPAQPVALKDYEPDWDLYNDWKGKATADVLEYNIGRQVEQNARYMVLDFNLVDLGTQLRSIDISYQPVYITLCLKDIYGRDITEQVTYKMIMSNGETIEQLETLAGSPDKIYINEELVTSILIEADDCFVETSIPITIDDYINNAILEPQLDYNNCIDDIPANAYNYIRWQQSKGSVTYPFGGVAPTFLPDKVKECTGCSKIPEYAANPYLEACGIYRPVVSPCDETTFYVNTQLGLDSTTLNGLQLDIIDTQYNTILTDVAPVLQNVLTGTQVNLYAEGIKPSGLVDSKFYRFVIFDTTTNEVIYLSNEFVYFVDDEDLNKITSYVEYRASQNMYYFDYEGLLNFKNKLRLHLHRLAWNPENTTDTYEEDTTGKVRNFFSTPRKFYEIRTYFFDDRAHEATVIFCEHDEIVLNRLEYTVKTKHSIEDNPREDTHNGSFELYEDRFSTVNKTC